MFGSPVLGIIFLLLMVACSSIPSGRYVYLGKGDNLVKLSRRYRMPAAIIINANKGKQIEEGEWLFVPLRATYRSASRRGDSLLLSKQFLLYGKLLWPVPSSTRISSYFGRRGKRQHQGIDIPARRGEHILAAADGVVTYSGRGLRGYGNLTTIKHRNNFYTVYAHANKNFTKKGQRVYRGQVIANVGNTGKSTGSHLHFEVRVGKKSVNPLNYVKKSRHYLAIRN